MVSTNEYMGDEALEFLSSNLEDTDVGASSHWQKYHSEFKFLGDRFEGLIGFGGVAKPYKGLRKWVHLALQKKFRKQGRKYADYLDIERHAKLISSTQNRAYNLDVLRQAITLSFLKSHVRPFLTSESTSCVIGDGFASMSSLLLSTGSARQVILINLTKTLMVDLWYLRLWMGGQKFNAEVCLLSQSDGVFKDAVEMAKPKVEGIRVIAIQASDHQLLRNFNLDMVINIVSMQEMNPSTIAAYFEDIRIASSRQELAFYCCNRESKFLPDGTETRFSSYPWDDSDRVIVDELCPWHQQYYSLRPPFYWPYDGPVQHRLVRI